MAASSQTQGKLTSRRAADEELEILENGGLSPQPSLRTDDDACSEIIRIEQQDAQEEKDRTSTMGRIVRSLQVSGIGVVSGWGWGLMRVCVCVCGGGGDSDQPVASALLCLCLCLSVCLSACPPLSLSVCV